MKSILIIANFASIHIYNYIKNTIDFKSCKVSGLTMSPITSIPSEYNAYYQENGIMITEENTQPNDTNRIKIKKIYKQLKTLGTFDVLHIHYVKHLYAPGIYLLRNNYKKIILTFWGSDLYRSTIISRVCILPILRIADKITFITATMKNDFFKKSIFHRGLRNRICVMDYGNMLFPYIDSAEKKIKEDTLSSYSTFNLSKERLTITIGYVGRPQMQQKEAIESILKNISSTIIDGVQIVIPAYGMKEGRLQYLRHILDEKSVQYSIIPDFLGPEKVALLRSLTDIFVHPQTTDAFSSSMQECFYANAVIINGSWLHYKDIENAGAYFLSFNSFDHLPDLLLNVIESIDLHKQMSAINKQVMLEMCSWDRWRQDWRSLYN